MVDVTFQSCIRLHTAIDHCLRFYAYNNATWLAELLVTQSHTIPFLKDQSIILLANVYLQSGRIKEARELLRDIQCLEAQYLFAKCCYELKECEEGERALSEFIKTTNVGGNDDTQPKFVDVPDEAMVYLCLGDLCSKSNRREQAIGYYREALSRNPWLWSAYEGLCRLGARDNAKTYFTTSNGKKAIDKMQTPLRSSNALLEITNIHDDKLVATPFSKLAKSERERDERESERESKVVTVPPQQTPGNVFGAGLGMDIEKKGFLSKLADATPSPSVTSQKRDVSQLHSSGSSNSSFTFDTSMTISPRPRASSGQSKPTKKQRLSSPESSGSLLTRSPKKDQKYGDNQSKPRFSFSHGESSSLATSKSQNQPIQFHIDSKATGGPTKSIDSILMPPPQFAPSRPTSKADGDVSHPLSSQTADEATENLMKLFQYIGDAIFLQCQPNPSDAIRKYETLSSTPHYHSRYIQSAIANCYMTMSNFKKAIPHFENSFSAPPFCSALNSYSPVPTLKDAYLYSSALWAIHDRQKLAHMSHYLVENFRNRPETWLVVGNTFALENERDRTIKCFNRAKALDENDPTVYICLGIEYTKQNNLDEGRKCFRKALAIDPTNYIAWFNLGKVEREVQNYELELHYYEKSIKYNPMNVIGLNTAAETCLSMRQYEKALEYAERALKIAPEMAPALKSKIESLSGLHKFENAISLAHHLLTLQPTEPHPYILLGKLYTHTKNYERAVQYLTWALDKDYENGGGLSPLILQGLEAVEQFSKQSDDSAVSGIKNRRKGKARASMDQGSLSPIELGLETRPTRMVGSGSRSGVDEI